MFIEQNAVILIIILPFQPILTTSPFAPPQIEEQIESMFNSKKRVKDLSAPGAAAGPTGTTTTTTTVPGGLPGLGPTSAGNIQKLEMAKRLALKINAQKNLGAEAQVCLCVFLKPEEKQRGIFISKWYICKLPHIALTE